MAISTVERSRPDSSTWPATLAAPSTSPAMRSGVSRRVTPPGYLGPSATGRGRWAGWQAATRGYCGAMADVLRVELVDDHEVVREGLTALLAAEKRLAVVGEAGTVAEAGRRGGD